MKSYQLYIENNIHLFCKASVKCVVENENV